MRTKIKHIKLTNFRNHKGFSFEPQSRTIAIYGQNGVGKTNILEAISLLAPGRGLRSAKLLELKTISYSEPWVVFAEIEGVDGETKIGTSLDYTQTGKEKRRVKINGEDIRGTSELAEYFSYIALTPSQDKIFNEGTTVRRDYLDRLCENFFPDYSDMIAVYNLAKAERRKLLIDRYQDNLWLDTLESRMAEKGVAIAYQRLELCELLNSFMNEAEKAEFPKANVSVEGEIENFIKAGTKAIEAENHFKDKLFDDRRSDAETKRTNFGIHKSDFRVIHSLKNMPAEFCSQGEQKALLLSLTIVSVIAKKARTGFYPILLLDEVASHLDDGKRAKLFKFINNTPCQTWLTSTEKEHFIGLEEAQIFSLKNH